MMNRRMQQPCRNRRRRSNSNSSSSTLRNNDKTVSRRAQRRLAKSLELEQVENNNNKNNSTNDLPQQLEMKKGVLSSTKEHTSTDDDSKQLISLVDQFDKAHHRIEASIKDYSNEISTINDSIKNLPTTIGIRPFNEFGLRKASGAIRYHNKSTLISGSRRRNNDNKSIKSEIMAHVVTKVVNDGCPSRGQRYKNRSYSFWTGTNRDDVAKFTTYYQVPLLHRKIYTHDNIMTKEQEVKDAISDMNKSANQLENQRTMGKKMMEYQLQRLDSGSLERRKHRRPNRWHSRHVSIYTIPRPILFPFRCFVDVGIDRQKYISIIII
jgi:hypothetical protein